MVDQMGKASTEMAGAYREGSEWFRALSTFEATESKDAAATSMGLGSRLPDGAKASPLQRGTLSKIF